MTRLALRQALVFAAIFFAANLAFDAYRHGGVTTSILGMTLLATAVATVLYIGFLRLMARRREGSK